MGLSPEYKLSARRRPQGLANAMREVGLAFQGREHSGIEDARNTARLVWKMVQVHRGQSAKVHGTDM